MFGGPKAGAQQTDGVQILQPLAVTDVGFATGEIFAVAGIDQTDFQAGGFEDLEEGKTLVDSMATVLTPHLSSQSRKAWRSSVKVAKVRMGLGSASPGTAT